MAHIKKLTRLGNSSALVIDRSIVDMLDLSADREVQMKTYGKILIVQAVEKSKKLKTVKTKRAKNENENL